MSVLYIYYWVLIIAFMPALVNPRRFRSLEPFYIIVIPVAYISCVFLFRDFNNSNDFQNYLYIYSEVVSFDDVFSRNGEFVFNIFLIIGNAMGVSYEAVYSILLLASAIGLSFSLYYSKIKFHEKLVVILFVVSCSGTYFLLANAFRQGLALNLMIAALVLGSARARFFALSLAPLLHFSSLLPILSIAMRKFFSHKYAVLFLIAGALLIVPIIQVLVFYRFDKYTAEYEYESSFQFFRIIIDFFVLFVLVVNRNKFTHVLPSILFFVLKILSYDLSPLIYSRISYYDVVIYCFIYLNCCIKNERWVKILIILLSIAYANLIFSVESLNSNFSFINK